MNTEFAQEFKCDFLICSENSSTLFFPKYLTYNQLILSQIKSQLYSSRIDPHDLISDSYCFVILRTTSC